jgi:NAD(P)-dependent dehydrogenase (short-subunit alcohol dehydrogenase family)
MGLAAAHAFVDAGATVALADVNENAICSATEKLVVAGRKAIAVRCNVADEKEVDPTVQ